MKITKFLVVNVCLKQTLPQQSQKNIYSAKVRLKFYFHYSYSAHMETSNYLIQR
jgi:hypothetical protein